MGYYTWEDEEGTRGVVADGRVMIEGKASFTSVNADAVIVGVDQPPDMLLLNEDQREAIRWALYGGTTPLGYQKANQIIFDLKSTFNERG